MNHSHKISQFCCLYVGAILNPPGLLFLWRHQVYRVVAQLVSCRLKSTSCVSSKFG